MRNLASNVKQHIFLIACYIYDGHLPSHPTTAIDGSQILFQFCWKVEEKKDYCVLLWFSFCSLSCTGFSYPNHVLLDACIFVDLIATYHLVMRTCNNNLRQEILLGTNYMSFEIKTHNFCTKHKRTPEVPPAGPNKFSRARHCTGPSMKNAREIYRPLWFYIAYIKQSRFTGI